MWKLLGLLYFLDGFSHAAAPACSRGRPSCKRATAESGPGSQSLKGVPPCDSFVLQGANQNVFNSAGASFVIKPGCNKKLRLSTVRVQDYRTLADTDNTPDAVLDDNLLKTPDSITVKGLGSGTHIIVADSKSEDGIFLHAEFHLAMGSVNMPLLVQDMDGSPAVAANVTAVFDNYFQQHQLTNSSGIAVLINLPMESVKLGVTMLGRQPASSRDIMASSQIQTLILGSKSPSAALASDPGHQAADDGNGSNSSRAILQPTCQMPPPKSCDFYTRCAEESLHCGPEGYPIRYGQKNCDKFVGRLDKFSSNGQKWIFQTMHCLQKALVEPITESNATCPSIQDAAFASHANCYIDSSFCSLSIKDWKEVVLTVKSDIFFQGAIGQVISTATGCVRRWLFGRG